MNSAFVGYEELSKSRRVFSTLLELLNSSCYRKPNSLIANYADVTIVLSNR